ncbi:MAG: GNAT family N-acetyltransferase [Acidimicrobiales bacterium]
MERVVRGGWRRGLRERAAARNPLAGRPALRRPWCMAHPYWPLFDLRVTTPRVELRLPGDDDLVELARVAAGGVHDAGAMPFSIPWTDAPSPQLERSSLQWWWRQRAEWSPASWSWAGAVFFEGRPVGVQDLAAKDFAQTRTVKTGSWLGAPFQGQGLGKEMRAAVLHLAFAGLGAAEAYSGAWHDNAASLGVSRALGYVDNGTEILLRRAKPDRMVNLRLDRAAWEIVRRDDITVTGLDGCLEMFGVSTPPRPPLPGREAS